MLRNPQANFLPPAQTNEFLPPVNRWTTFGGLFVLGFLLLSLPVAAVVKYKVTVKAQAIVRPTGELRTVQAATEGQIIQIYVKRNQSVKKGDVIAQIDDSRLQTKKSQLQTNIEQTNLQLLQIQAQINALENQIRAETERIKRNITSAQAELRGRNRAYLEKKITTISEVKEADANVKIAQKELQENEARLQSVQANLKSTEAALGAAKSRRNRYASVAKEGALSKDRMEEAELAVKQEQQAFREKKALVKAQKQTIERLKQAIKAAIARRSQTQAALNPSNSEIAIATERIAQERASGEANKANLEKERQALIKQQIEIQKQLERDRRQLKQVENDLKQTTITATEDGVVSKLNLRNSGQTVRAGEEVVQIVPSYAPKVIKASIASADKGKIEVGQKVQMRVSACPYPDYGILNGEVKYISPDAITPEKNGDIFGENNTPKANSKATFYEVTVEPKKLVLGNIEKKCYIELGMNGRADIITREETVLRFFLRKARLITDI